MRRIAVPALLCLFVATAAAASPPNAPVRPGSAAITVAAPGPLTAAASKEVARLAGASREPARQGAPDGFGKSSWRARHPVLFGALVGAGAGAPVALAIPEFACGGGDENCLFGTGPGALVGAGMGAGVGSLVGWLASLAGK